MTQTCPLFRAAAGNIGSDGEELATIIEGEYNKIRSSISISPGAGSFKPSGAEDLVSVSLTSNCPNILTSEDTVTCQHVTVTETFDFTATVEVGAGICAKELLPPNGTVSFDLTIFGQSNSSLRIDLSV